MEKFNEMKSPMPVPTWFSPYNQAPYRFINREFLIVNYETDPELLQNILPPGLELIEPIVKFEFIRMPDSSSLGNYTESGQVLPVRYKGEEGTFTLSMFLDNHPAITAGREIWGYPKKFAKPKLFVEEDAMIGTLDYESVRVATATMSYKYAKADSAAILQVLKRPVFLLKNILGVDGKPAINQLTCTYLTDIQVKEAWTGPATLELYQHVLAPVAKLPVRKVLSALHFMCDLTLPYGEVVEDYLAER